MDLYLKDLPVFGHISLIVKAVRQGRPLEQQTELTFLSDIEKVGKAEHITLSKRVQEGVEVEVENVVGRSPRVYLEMRMRPSVTFPMEYHSLITYLHYSISVLPWDIQSCH